MVKFSSRDGNDIPPFLGGNNMEQWYHSPTWWKLGRCCIDFAGLPGSGYPIYPTGEVWCRKNHLRCILPSPPSNMQLSWDVKPRTKTTFKTAFIWEGWHWKARKSTRQGTYIFCFGRILKNISSPREVSAQSRHSRILFGPMPPPQHLPPAEGTSCGVSIQESATCQAYERAQALTKLFQQITSSAARQQAVCQATWSTASLSAASIHFGHGASLFLQTTQRVSFGSQSKHFLIKEILWCSDSPQPFLTIPR